jgi:argininosuccinate synthase
VLFVSNSTKAISSSLAARARKVLYDPQIATMEAVASTYDQGDATGFIRLNALRLKVRAALKTKGKGD